MATAPPKLPAAPKKAAPTKTVAQAKAEQEAARAKQAAADKAIADKAAAAAAATKASQAKQAAENAAAKKAADIRAALEKDILDKISKASSKSQLDQYLADAKKNNVSVPADLLKAATASAAAAETAKQAKEAEYNRAANEKAAATKAAAEKAAAEKAAAAAAAKTAADKAAAEKAAAAKLAAENATKIQSAQNTFAKVISSGKVTQEQLDAYTKAVKDAGGTPQASLVNRGNQLVAAGKTTAINTAQSDFVKAINTGKVTQEQVDAYTKAVKDAGGSVNNSLLGQAQKQLDARAQAELVKKQQAEQAAALAAAQKQTALNSEYEKQLAGAKTSADIDRILAAAKDAGAVINQGVIDRANTVAQQTAANTAAQQLATKTQELQSQLAGAKTSADIDKILSDAKSAGITLNQGAIDRAQTIAKQTEAQVLAQKATDFQSQLLNAGSQQQLDKVIADAKAAGIDLNQGYIDRAQQNVNYIAARATTDPDYAAALKQLQDAGRPFSASDVIALVQQTQTQQNAEQNAQTQAALAAPGTELTTDIAGRDQLAIQQLLARGPEYQQAYDQLVASGQPFTSSDLTTLVNKTATTNLAQANAATQAGLSGPGTALQVPTGYFDRVSEANISKLLATGNPVYKQAYDQLLATGKPFTSNDLIKQTNAINTANLKSEAASTQAGLQAKGSGLSFGDIFGVAALLYIAPSIIGGFGSSSAATAAGIDAGELSSMATQLAAAGSTPAEIAGALEAAGVPASAATTAANAATAMISGAVEPAAVLASSSITPEMLALANATADPIAALNAAAGWTAVDTAYLASIGAAPQLISAAESTNIAAGYDPTGLRILTPEETAQIMQGVDPNMISSFAPTEPIAGATGGTAAATTTPVAPTTLDAVTQGALYGAGTTAVVNTITGQPITPESLLMGAIGGGVAGGVGTLLPNPAGSVLGAAGNAALTNIAGTTAVNLITGQPITFQNLATTALIGGTVGGAIQAYSNANGTITYRYDDGSTLTVDSTGRAVAVTDNTGASVPVAVQKAPVEDLSAPAQPMETTPVSTEGATGPVTPPKDLASTGISDSAPGTIFQGPNGPEIVLESGKTVLLSDYESALASGQPISVDGQLQTQFRVDVSGMPAMDTQSTELIKQNLKGDIPEGYELSNPDDPAANYDITLNAWIKQSGPISPLTTVEIPPTTVTEPITVEGPAVTAVLPIEPVAPAETTTTSASNVTTPFVSPSTEVPVTVSEPGPSVVTSGTTTTEPVAPAVTEPTVSPVAPTETTTGGTTTSPVSPTETTTPVPVNVVGNPDGSTTTTYSDGSTTTTAAGTGATGSTTSTTGGTTGGTTGTSTEGTETGLGTYTGGTGTSTTGTGTSATGTGGTTGTGTGGTTTGGTTGTETGGTTTGGTTGTETGGTTTPVEPTPTDTTGGGTTTPVEPTPVEPTPTDTTGGGTTTPTEPPYVAPPIYVPPIVPPTPEQPGYGPLPPLNWGTVGRIPLPGLNPGWITNVPEQYAATSPVQARYSWAQKPYQPGPTFNRALYQQNQPAQPWGLQQLYTPMNIQEYVRQQALATQRAIAPTPAPGPVKPA